MLHTSQRSRTIRSCIALSSRHHVVYVRYLDCFSWPVQHAATVGQKRDGGKYPKTWDSNYGSYPGRFCSVHIKHHTSYSSRACISFHFGINGKSRSRLLVQPSYSIVDIHLAPSSQSEQSQSLSSQVRRLDPAYSIIIHFNVLLGPTFPAPCIDKPHRLAKMPMYLAAIVDR
jgi:hypothetical protein